MTPEAKAAMAHDVEDAIEAPESSYAHPADVVRDSALNLSQKLEILKRWEQSEIDLQRASDEGMEGPPPSRLDDINNALLELDPTNDEAARLS